MAVSDVMPPAKNRRKVRPIDPDVLFETRLALRLSVADLAAKSGVATPTIYGLESGRRATARMTTICSLADALGITVDALLLDEEAAKTAAA